MNKIILEYTKIMGISATFPLSICLMLALLKLFNYPQDIIIRILWSCNGIFIGILLFYFILLFFHLIHRRK
jgi:hypothetical protein